MSIEPRCLKNEVLIAYSATGYIIPCCHFDRPYCFENDIPDLVQEKFNLKNVSSIEEIFKSDEWQCFFKKLSEKSDDLPFTCHHHCSDNPIIQRIKKII